MADELTERKAAAGRLLFDACEAVLGVEGPAALARASRRSKAWWSKLRSGKGGDLPDWTEMTEAVLDPGLAAEFLAALQQRHREAWLLLHDPDLLRMEPAQVLPPPRMEALQAFSELVRAAMAEGDYRAARGALSLLERVLTLEDPALLPEQHLGLLGQFLIDLSVCSSALGEHEESVRAAREAAASFRRLGKSDGEAAAFQQAALAFLRAGRTVEALDELERARRIYEALGLHAEAAQSRSAAAQVRADAAAGEAREWDGEPELARPVRGTAGGGGRARSSR